MEGAPDRDPAHTRVAFEIRPVPADVAIAWLENSLRILTAAREHADEISVRLSPALLELAEAYLRLWRSIAMTRDPFDWRAQVDADDVEQLVRQWVALGALSDRDLAVIGCEWAPEWSHAFYDALVDGCIRALLADPSTADLGEQLRAEPPGRGTD